MIAASGFRRPCNEVALYISLPAFSLLLQHNVIFWWVQGERREREEKIIISLQIIGLNSFLAKNNFFQDKRRAVQWQEPEGKIRAVQSSDFTQSVITAQQHKAL